MVDMPGLMSAAADEMAGSLKRIRATQTHNLSEGESAEEVVRAFFRRYLPESGVASGNLVDSKGGTSRQLDVILYSRSRTPVLFGQDDPGARVIPSEGAIAIVEVKTRLEPSAITSIVRNMASVKSLDKSAYYFETGDVIKHTTVHGITRPHFPTLYFVFAFEVGDLSAVARALDEQTHDLPVDQRVDTAVALDKGLITNVRAGTKIDAVPSSGTQLAPVSSPNALFLFCILACNYLLQARTWPIRLNDYTPQDRSF